MSSRNAVPAALVNALLAAGLGGQNAIDELHSSPDEGKPDRGERTSYGSRQVTAPSRRGALWALKQLSDLASDRNIIRDRHRDVVVWKD